MRSACSSIGGTCSALRGRPPSDGFMDVFVRVLKATCITLLFCNWFRFGTQLAVSSTAARDRMTRPSPQRRRGPRRWRPRQRQMPSLHHHGQRSPIVKQQRTNNTMTSNDSSIRVDPNSVQHSHVIFSVIFSFIVIFLQRDSCLFGFLCRAFRAFAQRCCCEADSAVQVCWFGPA